VGDQRKLIAASLMFLAGYRVHRLRRLACELGRAYSGIFTMVYAAIRPGHRADRKPGAFAGPGGFGCWELDPNAGFMGITGFIPSLTTAEDRRMGRGTDWSYAVKRGR
jgi:hypothetical protein